MLQAFSRINDGKLCVQLDIGCGCIRIVFIWIADEKEMESIFSYVSILIFAILFSLPYWINVIRASQMDWYSEAAARIGIFYPCSAFK